MDERKQLVARMQEIVAADLALLPLYYPAATQIYNAEEFDAWYFTEGGFSGNIPTAYNKYALITGRQDGLEVVGEDTKRALHHKLLRQNG